jgi:hypothetical protein
MHPQEQVNLFIAEQPEWQRRQLIALRKLIHSVDETIEEAWRSGTPHFDRNGSMLAVHVLKTCVSVWFHKGASLKDSHGLFTPSEKDSEREVRKYKLSEGDVINEKAFTDLVKQAVKANSTPLKSAESKPTKRSLVVPAELDQLLQKDEDALAQWEAFSTSTKHEYVEWVTDTKQEETRKRRLAKALELIRAGKALNDAHALS